MTVITKIISIVTAIIMALLPMGGAMKTSEKSASSDYPYTLEDMSVVYDNVDENGNYYPLVVVPGISHSITYVVDEDYDSSTAEDPSRPPIKKDAFGNDMQSGTIIFDIPEILKSVARYLIAPLVKSVVAQKDCGLVDAIGKVADAAFSVQKTLPDGTFANNEIGLLEFNGSFADFATPDDTQTQSYMQTQCEYLYKILPLRSVSEIIGEENLFFFTFSLFADPMSSAQRLDKYIDTVLQKTGAKKVNLLPISLGGTVFTAFCEQFTDTDKVNSIVNVVPVLNGTQSVTDMFNRDFDVSPEFWYNEGIPMMISEFTEYGELIGHAVNFMLRALPAEVNAAMLTRMYDVLLNNLFVNTPQIWAMVTREAYPELAERYLGDGEHDAIKAKTDSFYHAQLDLEDNIKTMTANGIKINIISGYGLHTGDARYNFFRVTANADKVNGDGVINVESTTLGATAALPGEKLTEGGRLSPDGEVDASTGILPDNTWYFYNMHHEDAANNAPVINLVLALMYSHDVENVNSKPEKYPQFNGNSDNWFIRRWRYRDIKAVYAEYQDGKLDWSQETVDECEAIMYDCERVMRATIADADFCKETTKRANDFLVEQGRFSAENADILTQKQLHKLPEWAKVLTKIITFVDDTLFKVYGDKAYSEFWKIYLTAREANG